VLDYTTTFKSANHVVTLYAPDAFRSSDHDPLLIGLDLATHPPVITSLEVTAGPVEVGEPADLAAAYTDLDGGETHVATVDWGDGTVAAGSVDQSADTVAATHAYADAGLYTVTLTVSDGTFEDTATHAYVVVVDPEGGSVVGAGVVNSPRGAYPARPNVGGLGILGMAAGYGPGADTPSGASAFALPSARFTFRSTGHDWLVVDGETAFLRGSGTVNGTAGYEFLIAVVDGRIDRSGPDRFRLKVWRASNGEVVYDSQPGAADDARPTLGVLGQVVILPS